MLCNEVSVMYIHIPAPRQLSNFNPLSDVDHCTKTYIPTTWESIGYADGNVLKAAN